MVADRALTGLRRAPATQNLTLVNQFSHVLRRRDFSPWFVTCAAVSITVVGSIAFDAVETPYGSRDRMLGGARHLLLAGRVDVRPGQPGRPRRRRLRRGRDGRSAHPRGQRRRCRARRGRQVVLLERPLSRQHGHRATRSTRSWACSSTSSPSCRRARARPRSLFLANIQPGLQLQVREQCERAEFVALDSMNLWIDIARDELVADHRPRRLPASQRRGAAPAHRASRPSTPPPRRSSDGVPSIIVAKQGEYGATLDHRRRATSRCRPTRCEQVVDPTGAGDTFAGGFVGFIATQLGRRVRRQRAAQRDGLRHLAGLLHRPASSAPRRCRRSPRRMSTSGSPTSGPTAGLI